MSEPDDLESLAHFPCTDSDFEGIDTEDLEADPNDPKSLVHFDFSDLFEDEIVGGTGNPLEIGPNMSTGALTAPQASTGTTAGAGKSGVTGTSKPPKQRTKPLAALLSSTAAGSGSNPSEPAWMLPKDLFDALFRWGSDDFPEDVLSSLGIGSKPGEDRQWEEKSFYNGAGRLRLSVSRKIALLHTLQVKEGEPVPFPYVMGFEDEQQRWNLRRLHLYACIFGIQIQTPRTDSRRPPLTSSQLVEKLAKRKKGVDLWSITTRGKDFLTHVSALRAQHESKGGDHASSHTS